tara:strand:- start:482 stop:649 length:168 start_codon:yes stop_codon:yes gene_type:complete
MRRLEREFGCLVKMGRSMVEPEGYRSALPGSQSISDDTRVSVVSTYASGVEAVNA